MFIKGNNKITISFIFIRDKPWRLIILWRGFLRLIWWWKFLIICVRCHWYIKFSKLHILFPFSLFLLRRLSIHQWRRPFSSFRGLRLISYRLIIFQRPFWRRRLILFKRRFRPWWLRNRVKLKFQQLLHQRGLIQGRPWLQQACSWRCRVIQLRKWKQLT